MGSEMGSKMGSEMGSEMGARPGRRGSRDCPNLDQKRNAFGANLNQLARELAPTWKKNETLLAQT